MGQNIGPNVGLCVIENLLRRAVGAELPQYPENALVMGSGVQLPIREGPGTALAELHVALRVQRTAGLKALYVQPALLHVLTALDYKGAKPCKTKYEGGEHPSRAKSDNERPFIRMHRGNWILRFGIRYRVSATLATENKPLVSGNLQRNRTDITDAVFLTRIQ